MILYDNQKITTTVYVSEESTGDVDSVIMEATQVFLSEGAYVVVGEKHIFTFNSSKYSVSLKHNVKEIQALENEEYEKMFGWTKGKDGVVH